EASAPFDLTTGPLMRARLIHEADEVHALLLTFHHIVADGWSLGVLERDLSLTYASVVRGTANRQPALPVQYADYAVWQRDWVSGPRLQAQAAYLFLLMVRPPP